MSSARNRIKVLWKKKMEVFYTSDGGIGRKISWNDRLVECKL